MIYRDHLLRRIGVKSALVSTLISWIVKLNHCLHSKVSFLWNLFLKNKIESENRPLFLIIITHLATWNESQTITFFKKKCFILMTQMLFYLKIHFHFHPTTWHTKSYNFSWKAISEQWWSFFLCVLPRICDVTKKVLHCPFLP